MINANEYKYKVSLIIPVYNVENYLEMCLNSIVKQTIDKDELEVLLINDGSTDRSYSICKEYSEIYSFFKVYTKENTGVSDTRNFGIKHATGKYIMYLDSDDTLSKETIKNVTDFFDKHYSEIDMVTYPEYTTINGVKQPLHFRYKFYDKSGIYDLAKVPYAIQTRLGICIKNDENAKTLFDETMSYHEDQKYIVEILRDKMKIGFCKEAAYYWQRNDGGIMADSSNPIQVFEVATKFYEDIFSNYEKVPQYFQAMFVHDINWKMRSNMFFPYHYDEQDFENAMNRIQNLLKKIDVDTIRKHPGLDAYHVYYFLKLKGEKLTGIVTSEYVYIYHGNECLYKVKKIEIIMNSFKVCDEKVKIDAFLKSPIFEYIEKPEVSIVVKYNSGEIKKYAMDLFESAGGYYKSKTKTNLFWGFVSEINICDVKNMSIEIVLDGITFETGYYYMPYCSMSKENPKVLSKEYEVTFENNIFNITKVDSGYYNGVIESFLKQKTVKGVPLNSLGQYAEEKVWLYYDCSGVEKDNAYYQFCHDIQKDDGIKRYYVCANDISKYSYLFEGMEDYVIKFGSMRHKLLYLAADKIITAFIEEKNIIPFEVDEYQSVKFLSSSQIIYLQHGILHAHLPWKYTPSRILADRIVASSNFEMKGFVETYNFPKYMLIPSGQPRFELIDKKYKQTNKILFAPSWRNYLIGPAVGNKWTLTESKFLKSNYYKEINAFLNSEQLELLLEKYDMILDFKIHPIFVPYLELFENKNERVRFVTEKIVEEEYKIVITDFSSFIFNFAYLKRPIIYYVPDYTEFKAGLNQYWELDLPFEKAFGALVTNCEKAIEEVEKICSNKFAIDRTYEQRMDDFFLPIIDVAEKIYCELIKR